MRTEHTLATSFDVEQYMTLAQHGDGFFAEGHLSETVDLAASLLKQHLKAALISLNPDDEHD